MLKLLHLWLNGSTIVQFLKSINEYYYHEGKAGKQHIVEPLSHDSNRVNARGFQGERF